MDGKLLAACIQLVGMVRAAGFNAEIYLDPGHKLKKQLAYADARGIPAAVLLGSNEAERGEVTVKDLRAGATAAAAHGDRSTYLGARAGQATIPAASLADHLRALLRPQ
jgi:histidyl-tRNA synthetase